MAQKAEIRSNLPAKIQTTLNNFWSMSLIFATLMLLLRIIEFVYVFNSHAIRITIQEVIGFSLFEDVNWILYFLGLLFIVHVFMSLVSVTFAKRITQILLVMALLVQTVLIAYFPRTFLPLGNLAFGRGQNDLILAELN